VVRDIAQKSHSDLAAPGGVLPEGISGEAGEEEWYSIIHMSF